MDCKCNIDAYKHKSLDTIKLHSTDCIKIKDINQVIHNIHLTEISFIETTSHQIAITTSSCIIYSKHTTSHELTAILPDNFIRCHKKYIINEQHILNYDVTNKLLRLSTGLIPVGRTYHQNIKSLF